MQSESLIKSRPGAAADCESESQCLSGTVTTGTSGRASQLSAAARARTARSL